MKRQDEDYCRTYPMERNLGTQGLRSWTVQHVWQRWDARYQRCYHCGAICVSAPALASEEESGQQKRKGKGKGAKHG